MIKTPTLALTAALLCAGAAHAQDRPPVVLPGSGAPQEAAPPSIADHNRMATALKEAGCQVNLSNREAVLQAFGADAEQARATLTSMEAERSVRIDAQRGTATLVGCVPVPMAGEEAMALQ